MKKQLTIILALVWMANTMIFGTTAFNGEAQAKTNKSAQDASIEQTAGERSDYGIGGSGGQGPGGGDNWANWL